MGRRGGSRVGTLGREHEGTIGVAWLENAHRAKLGPFFVIQHFPDICFSKKWPDSSKFL